MVKKPGSVLFLGKAEDSHVEKAVQFCRANFKSVGVFLGGWDDPFPAGIAGRQWDYIISYLSRWVVPQRLLSKAKVAVNFHPGPPEYPGYGCNNFAIYEEASEYGVTCHHMARKVDAGPIIAVRRLPVLSSDNAATLLRRAYDFQLVLFYEIAGCLIRGEKLPVSAEKWSREPFTRKDFARLARISADMSKDEVGKRIRATDMGRWKPTVEVHGYTFELKTEPGS
jgi:methionyl-tRNA formyltransferase